MIRRRGCLKGFNHLSFVHFEGRKRKWVRYGKTPLSENNEGSRKNWGSVK
jgi:hypothetical protein